LKFYRYGKQKIRLVLLLGSISAARRPTLFFANCCLFYLFFVVKITLGVV